jgi:hypothetical protein
MDPRVSRDPQKQWHELGGCILVEFARHGHDPYMNVEVGDDHILRLRQTLGGKVEWMTRRFSDADLAGDLTTLATTLYADAYPRPEPGVSVGWIAKRLPVTKRVRKV